MVDYGLSRCLDRIETTGWRRAVLVFSLVLNLGLLAYFKYGVFLVENLFALMGWFGVATDHQVPDIILPLGISFYTFETIS